MYKRVKIILNLYLYHYWAFNAVALRKTTEGKFLVFVSFIQISL